MIAMAQEEKPIQGEMPATESAFQLAAGLAKYGYSHNDALSLIQAARIAKQEGFALSTRVKAEGQTEATAATQFNLNPDQLLADARAKASGDDVILALIDDAAAMSNGTRGSSRPIYTTDVVSGNSYDLYHHTFRGDEGATVICIGDGDTDLDLYIYDENYNLIAKDDDYTDDCVCTFRPYWTGTFYIKIVNRGRIANRYLLRSN